MDKPRLGSVEEFKVLCVNCGVKIRNHASEDSCGLCLKCFYRILAERLREQKRTAAGEFVSER
ncbi:MAG: hypothetical protein QOF62_1672 [Pyrinomonadaceae bacterium]|jgi:hypothetical protein|nr:hypothetical protein [Pyrinomonadaceae bacterium]